MQINGAAGWNHAGARFHRFFYRNLYYFTGKTFLTVD
jgi:hypothetical protein